MLTRLQKCTQQELNLIFETANFNIMRKILLFSIFIALLSSCEDALQEVPKDFVSRVNFYQNQADAESAIAGVYASFGVEYYGISFYLMEELHSDYIFGRGSQAPITEFGQVLDRTNIGRAATNWSTLYQAINRANAVLNNVPDIADIEENVRTRILAEAHFLRAMAYFNLVRNWGPVPIKINESVDVSDIAAPREPESKVYELIIADALVAEQSLPESVGNETGRASKWAAKMLLGQVYLTLERWSDAAEKSEEVINSGQFSLVLVEESDDFYKIFAAETHSEDIMSVHHSPTRTSELPTYLHRGNTFPYNYSSRGFYAWLPDTSSFIGNEWNDADLRKDFNLYREHLDGEGNTVALPATSPILFKKFTTNPDGLSIYSVPIFRYSEAFLMYAEAAALAAGNPTELALEKLNIIRRRAYGFDPFVPSAVDYPAGMGQGEFRDAVLQERAYEFLLERRRWWDLKRTGSVKEAFAATGKTFIDERLLWPIPEDEINNNPAIGQENQNPGY